MNDPYDNERDDRAMLARLDVSPAREALEPHLVARFGPRTAHVAIITPEDGGFLVTCPEGCALGTSEHQPDRLGAERRIELHRLATAPLGPGGLETQPS
jgi:hypothetical protein